MLSRGGGEGGEERDVDSSLGCGVYVVVGGKGDDGGR